MGNLLLSIGIPVLVGLILLFIEYRTKWFANRFSSEKHPISILNAKVTPIGELDNPIGDWLQVAGKIKVLLEKNTKQERETDISLLKIEPDKRKKSAKLTFTFMGDDLTSTDLKEYCYWYVYITVTEDGRIIDYQRDTELV